MRICLFTRVRGALLLLLLLLLLLSIARFGSPPQGKAKADPMHPGIRHLKSRQLSAISTAIQP
jgi:hypothetical protein